jgi:predicted permease
MVSYGNVLQVGGGILIMIALGFTLTKTRIADPEHFASVNRFLFKCCFIPLVAKNMVRQQLAEMNFMLFFVFILAAVASQLILCLMMIYPVADRFGTYLETMLPATYVNFIIIGIPIFESLWPDGDSSIPTIVTLSNDLFTAPAYLILTGIYAVIQRNRIHKEQGEPLERFGLKALGKIGLGLITNPIMIGYVIGFVWAGAHFPVPLAMDEAIKYLSETCLPMSCLCVGSFLAQHSLISCHWAQFALCSVARHVIYPMFAGVFAWALKLSATASRQCVILATLPSAVASYALSTNAGVGAGVSSTMIFWTNVFFLPSAILWFLVMDKLGLFLETE